MGHDKDTITSTRTLDRGLLSSGEEGGTSWNPLISGKTSLEVGRVAGEYNLKRLHSDMKWDVDFGVRAMVNGLGVRIDTAASTEQVGVQMFISQPFQFKPLNCQSAAGGAAEDELSLTAKRMSSELTTAPNLLLSFFKAPACNDLRKSDGCHSGSETCRG
jgi:hypothetical protein